MPAIIILRTLKKLCSDQVDFGEQRRAMKVFKVLKMQYLDMQMDTASNQRTEKLLKLKIDLKRIILLK
jgi:hypothetical protein